MTLYMLFAGLGSLVYLAWPTPAKTIAGFIGARVAFGLQSAFLTSRSPFLAAVVLFPHARGDPESVGHGGRGVPARRADLRGSAHRRKSAGAHRVRDFERTIGRLL